MISVYFVMVAIESPSDDDAYLSGILGYVVVGSMIKRA